MLGAYSRSHDRTLYTSTRNVMRLMSRLTAPHAASGDVLSAAGSPCGASSSLSVTVDAATDDEADEDDETGACEGGGAARAAAAGKVSFVRGCTAVNGDGE